MSYIRELSTLPPLSSFSFPPGSSAARRNPNIKAARNGSFHPTDHKLYHNIHVIPYTLLQKTWESRYKWASTCDGHLLSLFFHPLLMTLTRAKHNLLYLLIFSRSVIFYPLHEGWAIIILNWTSNAMTWTPDFHTIFRPPPSFYLPSRMFLTQCDFVFRPFCRKNTAVLNEEGRSKGNKDVLCHRKR